MKSLIKHSFVAGGMLALNLAQAISYNPGLIADMPNQTQAFLARLQRAGNNSAYLSTLPDSRRGMRSLETYYRNRYDYFLTVLDKNIAILSEAERVVAEAARGGGDPGKEAIATCVKEDRDWRDFRNSFEALGQLRQYAETSMQNNYPGFERPTLNPNVLTAFNRVGAYLDVSRIEGSFLDRVQTCCKVHSPSNRPPVCNEDYVRGKLEVLSQLQKLPSNFVDPMNPGPIAQNLSPEDVVTLMSLGQMQDFVEAKDFNSQALALMDADLRCENSRETALKTLNKRGELKSVANTGIQALQCSMGYLARNWGKTGRMIALGVVKGEMPLFGDNRARCPQQVQDAATMSLSYPQEAFRADFTHLMNLPGNIVQSQPIAKPVEIYNANGTLMLDLRDEAGYTRDSMYVSDQINAQYSAMLANSSRAASSTGTLNVVSTGTAGTTSTIRSTGRSIVNGIGSSRGNGERVLVRTLAGKASEGDLESARSLAGATRNRKTQLQEKVTQAKGDRALASTRTEKRATEARSLVTRATTLEAAGQTAKAFQGNYSALHRALGLSNDDSSGRVVERPGGKVTGSTSSTGGSTVTSNLPAYADRVAADEYKRLELQKNIAKIQGSIRSMAENINAVGARLNNIIKEKQAAIEKFQATFNPAIRFKELSDLGMDARADKLVSLNKTWARMVKEINILNTQEIGIRATISTAKMSFTNYVNAAQAFQGLDVRRGNVRAPASADPMFAQNPALMQQQQLQIPQLNPTTGGSSLAPGMTPPVFSPSPLLMQQPGTASLFKWLEFLTLPTAHADTLTPSQKRAQLLKEFEAFMKANNEYVDRIEAESIAVRQQGWERFILNEREMRKEALLSSESRVIVGSFNDAVKEELPELIKAKNGALASGVNPQIYKYIEQLRTDSAELNDLVIQESTISLDSRSMNPALDDESWTGMLPAISLQ